ncbi:hypothetical protein GCM10023084_74210 [Streptomyces lacrimifluminis]|uniref:Uncharacterized protein n=1 Tax=Streptomyces lacrimifluminis TaxID=1500077 RepID=A0A917UKN3_9ACTN|nr:hypothetical protein [Streptomyces lacrimifluminis]GGJ64381.1 hypothetical protein GCM10012282_71880 [Streptomyces lacrimifluminis]
MTQTAEPVVGADGVSSDTESVSADGHPVPVAVEHLWKRLQLVVERVRLTVVVERDRRL